MSQESSFKQRTKPNLSIKFLLLLTVFQLASFAASAAGEVDPSFNINVGRNSIIESVNALAVQPDGKILVGGSFSTANGATRISIARFNPDGLLDPTFNAGQVLRDSVASGKIFAIAVQPDGKIVIGGGFNRINGTFITSLARLNPDGSLDASFTPLAASNFSGEFNAVAVQPDGKIVAGGSFSLLVNFPGGATARRTNLARFNADGSFDQVFDQNPPIVRDILVQTDGRIYVAGGDFSTTNAVFRLNQNGTIDSSYAFLTTNNSNPISAIAQQADGKIIAVGSFTNYAGASRGRIVRLNLDGTVDESFNSGGAGANGTITDAAVTPDGRIVIVGAFTSYNGTQRSRVARLNADGTLDASFNYNGPTTGINLTRTVALPDGRVLIAGSRTQLGNNLPNSVARLNADGSVDAGFTVNVYIINQGNVTDFATQTDGKILVGGNFSFANGFPRNYLFRLNADGSFDAGFNPNINIGTGVGFVYTVATQTDGKILVGGELNPDLQRLNADGTRDVSFVSPIQSSSVVHTVIAQADGKILVGGSIQLLTSNSSEGIVRLNADGSRDTSFNVSTSGVLNGAVNDIILQPDGKIIIVGNFTQVGGVARGRIARLNADGSVDASFNPPFGANGSVDTALVQPNGKILIGGQFTAVNGSSRAYLARLNANGSLDNDFNPAPNSQVYAIVQQPDGKILVGGLFTALGATTRNRYARLNADGTIDVNFNPGVGANNAVLDFAFQQDGRILIGGNFTQVGGQEHIGLARIVNSFAARRTQYDFDGDGRADFAVFRPANSTWYILNSSNNSFTAVQFGAPGDVIAPADYDGDGRTDIAVYRENVPGTGGRNFFYILQSSNGAFRPEQFGAVGDRPVPADFDGDGRADLAVYRDGSQTGAQSFFFYRPSSQPGVDFRTIAWGTAGDKQAAADYDGDGRQDAAVFRPSNANWYILRSSDNQIVNVQFGIGTDVPVPADYDGDGRANIAVYRPSNGTWYTSTDPAINYGAVRWGAAGDVPIPTDYDGDGRADVAVFRPDGGNWYVLRSASGFLGVQWGTATDKPAPSAFVP